MLIKTLPSADIKIVDLLVVPNIPYLPFESNELAGFPSFYKDMMAAEVSVDVPEMPCYNPI